MARFPVYIAVSPATLRCSRCGAKAGKACDISVGEVVIIHIERIAAAAAMDVAAKKARKARR
jgi:hypothetical protein